MDTTIATRAAGAGQPRFVRRTTLGANEYRKNFHQIDREIIAAVSSAEADKVTPLMSKIYLRLANAPDKFWERQGVLRIEAEAREDGVVKAWAVLCELVGVSSATASKALSWMHEQGIVGYYSGKNGAGLRVFLNRAVASIGVRQVPAAKKILPFHPASNEAAQVSPNEPASKDSYADRESLDSNLNPPAPKNGAGGGTLRRPSDETTHALPPLPIAERRDVSSPRAPNAVSHDVASAASLAEMVTRLRAELEPALQAAARQAAAREHERTREWLESRGLPKAARVAQREAFGLLRKYGLVGAAAGARDARAGVGRGSSERPVPQTLTRVEVAELAEACVAMLESKGQPVELTLSGMGAEAGGFLLPEDAARVRDEAASLLSAKAVGRGE